MLDKPGWVFIVGFGYAVVFVILIRRLLLRRKHYGPAMSGSFEELLDNDRRRAMEIVIEERAEAREPEDRDGNLPQLDRPTS